MAAAMEAEGIGAAGQKLNEALEFAALSSLAPADGFAASPARSKIAGIRKMANAAVAIILTLNFIFAS
jgi:hypothetical protein